MIPVIVNVDGKEINVKLIKSDSSKFWQTAFVNEEEVQYHFVHDHILLKDSSYSVIYKTLPAGKIESVQINGHNMPLELENLLHERKHFAGGKDSAGKKREGTVYAPLNGQVIRLLKKKGEQVEVGEKVIVLESMKMENEINAPVSGIMKRIEVKEGAVVASGYLLFVIE